MTHKISATAKIIALITLWAGASGASAQTLAQGFAAPPADARPMVRWWWFGSAVEPKGLAREITAMRQGGFGGFEIQPVYPLAMDDPAKGLRNLDYLSPDFSSAVRFTNEEARRQGMRADMTLGSGWPYGGPHIGITQASAQLRLVRIPLAAGATDAPLPWVGSGERLLSVFIADGAEAAVDAATATPLPFDAKSPRVAAAASDKPRTILAFMQSRTGQQLKRPGIGGEGFVLDHMSRAAVQRHIDAVGEPLLKAFGDAPPYAVFSDSLEVYGADWTDDLLEEFRKRRGYDLTPHLPALYFDRPESLAVRRDWGLTLSELTDERYLTPLNTWAEGKGTRFRSQTYGLPPVTLSSQRRVALAEGEGASWRRFTSTRWASSANHLYDKPVTSAEAWTWLHQGAFRATPLDIKAEADTLFLSGVNQFIAHGWPYTPASEAEPGWAFYAAAVFNDHNPWWPVMADVNKYLQRVSHLLRQGENVADVGILIATDDAFAMTRPGRASVNDHMGDFITPALTEQILDAGFAFDYVDGAAIDQLGFKHKVLVLPKMVRISPDLYRKIAAFAAGGGTVIAVDRLPDTAPGLVRSAEETAEVKAISASLFTPGSARARQVAVTEVGAALKTATAPDITGQPPAVGFVHRKLGDGDLYFVANTSNVTVRAPLAFRAGAAQGQWWNPLTGEAHEWTPGAAVSLAPYESRLFVFGAAASAPVAQSRMRPAAAPINLSTGWTVKFEGLGVTAPANLPDVSWSENPETRFYSGVATYSRRLNLSRAQIAAGQTLLNFGEGKVVEQTGRRGSGTMAYLEPPVREAAEVFVNGKRAGSIWTAPFTLDLAPHLKAGANTLEIKVSNTAINRLAGQAAPDYRLLNIRYGERFTPQGMANLSPLPSGILGTVTLETAR